MVGIIAGELNLKSYTNGQEVTDAVMQRKGLRHYSTFKYYPHVIEPIRESI